MEGHDFRLLSAKYGANEAWADVIDVVRPRIVSPFSQFGFGYWEFPDPCYGTAKCLVITFLYHGKEQVATVPEGKWASLLSEPKLPCPSLPATMPPSGDPLVSVVMSSYHRSEQLGKTLDSLICQHDVPFEIVVVEDGFDGGLTKAVCDRYPPQLVRYFCRTDRPNVEFSIPTIPNNIAIRQARGKVLLIQPAEIRHVTEGSILKLVQPVLSNPCISNFASVSSLGEDGKHVCWIIHHELKPMPLYACQAVDRAAVMYLRGFDEDFVGYGFDDDDFSFRLQCMGVGFMFSKDVVVEHQFHGQYSDMKEQCWKNGDLFRKKMKDEIPVRNVNREWGRLR